MTAAPRTSKEGPGMTLRTKAAAVALAAGLLMAPMAAIVTPAACYGAPDEAVTRAADWLGQQFTDGQYLIGFDGVTPDPTYTIDGTLALVSASTQAETVDSAVAWVTSQAAGFVTNPASAARVAILADAVGADVLNFGGVDLVAQLQAPLDESTFANPYGLAMLVIALERTDTAVPQSVLDALLATQDAQGAFGFPEFGVDIDSTALAALALGSLKDNEQASQANQKAVDWLVANQCTQTSQMCPTTGAYWGSYSPANTAGLAIQALRQAGVDVSAQVDWLVGQQQPDGGFPAAIGAGYSDAYATAQATLGLSGADLTNVSKTTVDASAPPASDPGPAAGNQTGLIVAVAVGVVAIGVVVYYLRVRRRGPQA